ncbi:MAG: PKD domain-containing protein [Proteobacteria bacterium]|nr:PKD domain-containing protein [Pseudomonadota bacterium]
MALGLIWLACAGSVDLLQVDAGGPYVGFVGQEIELGSGSVGAGFTWRFGDGESAEGDVVSHAYQQPGNYFASLTGVSEDGREETVQVPVTIVYEPLDEAPRSSAAMVEGDGSLFVVMPDFDAVAVVDLGTSGVTHLETCGMPRSVSYLDGRLAVACIEDDVIEVFEGAERVDRIELPVGARPFGVVWTGEGLAVTTWLGLWINGEFVNETRDLRGLASVGDTLVWSRHRSPDSGGEVWVDQEFVTLESDAGPDTDTDARGLPSYLQRIVVRPDGRTAVLPGLKANIERGTVRDGLDLTFETTTRAELRQIGLDGSQVAEPEFDNRDLALAAAWSPLGDRLYVAHVGARIIDVLDGFTMQRIGGVQQLGNGLDGLWASDTDLWAHQRFDREVVRIDLETMRVVETVGLLVGLDEVLDPQVLAGQKIFYGAFDRRMSGDSYISCASCHLDGDHDGRTWDFTSRGEGLRNTKALWAMAGQGPLHWSANFDEVQDFNRDIRESMGGTGFLSDEDIAETEEPFGPSKAGRSEDLDALTAYVESLADHVPTSPFSTTDGGIAAWQAGGCGDCHSGERLTDSSEDVVLYDVGTLTDDSGSRLGEELVGIDTPSLLSVFYTAPYLHDGSAESLQERFDADVGGQHGAPLSAEETDALIGHLLSL